MSNIFKNTIDILSEAACTDDCMTNTDDPNLDDEYSEEILSEYDDYDELDDDTNCTDEMVNVLADEKNNRYLIEYDNLAKFMESAGITDPKEAMERVCECNSINFADTYLVLESQQSMAEMIDEAKAKLSDKAKKRVSNKLKSSAKFLKDVKNKGIKVLKKKNKKC